LIKKRLNIKNAEAKAIAVELAQQDGITITQAVLEALRAYKIELAARSVQAAAK
jgi:hypothetical protein